MPAGEARSYGPGFLGPSAPKRSTGGAAFVFFGGAALLWEPAPVWLTAAGGVSTAFGALIVVTTWMLWRPRRALPRSLQRYLSEQAAMHPPRGKG